MTINDLRVPVRLLAPALLIVGVCVVLLAQFWNAVPIATAIALVAWGTFLAAPRRRGVMAATAVAYAALGVFTIASQVDLALDASLAWGWFVAIDGATAFMLLYSLLCQAGGLLAEGVRR